MMPVRSFSVVGSSNAPARKRRRRRKQSTTPVAAVPGGAQPLSLQHQRATRGYPIALPRHFASPLKAGSLDEVARVTVEAAQTAVRKAQAARREYVGIKQGPAPDLPAGMRFRSSWERNVARIPYVVQR